MSFAFLRPSPSLLHYLALSLWTEILYTLDRLKNCNESSGIVHGLLINYVPGPNQASPKIL